MINQLFFFRNVSVPPLQNQGRTVATSLKFGNLNILSPCTKMIPKNQNTKIPTISYIPNIIQSFVSLASLFAPPCFLFDLLSFFLLPYLLWIPWLQLRHSFNWKTHAVHVKAFSSHHHTFTHSQTDNLFIFKVKQYCVQWEILTQGIGLD